VFVRVHLNFHLRSRLDVFIGNMELRSLSASHYRTISNLRGTRACFRRSKQAWNPALSMPSSLA
jgi:hypothetical protein